MSSKFILALFIVILLTGCLDQLNREAPLVSIERGVREAGLGELCIGEQECRVFCHDNRGQCDEYCQNNPGNSLCKTLFDFENQVDTPNAGGVINATQADQQVVEIPRNCTNNSVPVFSAPFTDEAKINFLSPIGGIVAGSPARSYVFVKSEANGSHMFVPVYAPTNSTLIGITYGNRNYNELGVRPEYRLDFEVSCQVSYTFDHLPLIVDKIKAQAPLIPANHSRTGAVVSIPIQAGELLAYTDGTFSAGSWDFMVLNTAKQPMYVNPSRWPSAHALYGDCPYNYFTPELKNRYYSLFKTSANGEQSCGSVSRDVAGTIAGGWFQGNSTDFEGTRLAVATIGDYVDLRIDRPGQSRFTVRHFLPPILPESVTVGNSVCYYDQNNYAFLKLLTNTEMEVAAGTGPCPQTFPTQSETWQR